MSTYNGWTVVTMPATPPAPAMLEVRLVDLVAMSRNPFSGQQQTQSWGAAWKEVSVTLPPLSYADAQAWVSFFGNLQGVHNVFQFGTALCAQYPELTNGGTALYWRLKANERGFKVRTDRYYDVSFEAIQAF